MEKENKDDKDLVLSIELHIGPGVNIFQNLWIIIREKFPFFNPFGKSLSYGVFTRFVVNCKKLRKIAMLNSENETFPSRIRKYLPLVMRTISHWEGKMFPSHKGEKAPHCLGNVSQ